MAAQDWWTAYEDPQLNALIAEGLAEVRRISSSPKRACTRPMPPPSNRTPAFGPISPPMARSSETRASLNQGFPAQFQSFLPHGWHDQGQITGNASYDLDLFGDNRAAFAAATSDADAARVDLAASRLTLSTAIASAYANLVQLMADRAAAEESPSERDQSDDLVRQRLAAAIGK